MARNSGLSYQVSRNGSANDWYWEVVCDRKIIDRGVAPTRAQARAQALKVARSYLVQENSIDERETDVDQPAGFYLQAAHDAGLLVGPPANFGQNCASSRAGGVDDRLRPGAHTSGRDLPPLLH